VCKTIGQSEAIVKGEFLAWLEVANGNEHDAVTLAHRLGAGLAAVVGVSGEVVWVRAVDPAAFTELKPEGQA
jgi:hypothetical protein